ncbi:MAG TPA: DUF4405 domain-containing protein [Albitalea sp.]|nr:DUF4405 domain-containing protein [Albitalea sp.]
MTRPAHRLLTRWQRLALHASGLALLLTGIAWLAVHYSVGAGAGELPHPVEAWAMRLHGLAAFAGLFVFGVLAGSHIPHGWRMSGRHRWASQRGTGLVLCIAGGALVLTGYLLYYFAPETIRPALGWLHSALGIAMGALVILHKKHRSRHLHART